MTVETKKAPPEQSNPTGEALKQWEAITINPLLESTVKALNAISPPNQELVAILVRQLAEREGINVGISPTPGLQTPAEGIPLWVAKLKQEGYSRRTLEVYLATIKNYLGRDSAPTKLSIQQWLADRLEQVSSAQVATDRKALRSLFSFLYEEGLWPFDPTMKLKSIRVRYRAREVPKIEDIRALLQYECHREKDTSKFRMMTVLLITTGLRVSEAAGILKKDIDLRNNEIKVIGKGDKEGVIPLLPISNDFLQRYTEAHTDDSPYLFPGDSQLGYWSISSYEKTLKRACEKLGIGKITPHQFRHFFATEMLRGGAKLEVVSKILRHSSVGITADIYRHVLTDEMHETMEQFAPLSQQILALPEPAAKEAD